MKSEKWRLFLFFFNRKRKVNLMLPLFLLITAISLNTGCQKMSARKELSTDSEKEMPSNDSSQGLPENLGIIGENAEVGEPLKFNWDGCTIVERTGGLGPVVSEYWKDKLRTVEQVRSHLENAIVINEEEWKMNYSHVAGGDQVGDLILHNGERFTWRHRPGGLGTLSGQDKVIYLVLSRANQRETGESGS